jgi:hypothetical protein
MKFFDKYFDLTVVAHGTPSYPVRHFITMSYSLWRIGKNFIVWYKTTNIPRHPGQTIIV